VEILLFRTALAPSLVLVVSLAARRLGPRVGGQFLGWPTTTGPYLALVSMTSGAGAAAQATHGSVTGQLVVVVFALAYGRIAPALRGAPTLLVALGCAVLAGVAGGLCPTIWLTAGLALAVILGGLWTWPAAQPFAQSRPRAWEIPVRMALAGATVPAAMAVATFAGGVVSSLPVLMAVMAPSLHRSGGAAAAVAMTRGAMTAAIGTIAFLLVLSTALVSLGAWIAFPLALAAMATASLLLRVAASRLATT
jgi:hypothetical protein